jgi:hypothetical protein
MYQSINNEIDYQNNHIDKKSNLEKIWALPMKLGAAFFVLVSFITICNRSYKTTLVSVSNTEFTSTSTTNSNVNNDFSIEISVKDPTYGTIETLDDLPWDALAEPYKKQLFSIKTFTVSDKIVDVSDYIVCWSIDNNIFHGDDTLIMLNNTGIYDATASITTKLSNTMTSNTVYTYDFTLAVKYVRREIRSLTDEDRETIFTALELLYSLTTERSCFDSLWI